MTETRLFGAFEGAMGKGDFADELYTFAYNIETTLIQAGAKPGKDYTYLDLIKMAEPYMRDKMQTGGRIEVVYPAGEVI